MMNTEAVQITDIIGNSGKYQRIVFLVSFYFAWFMGTSSVTNVLFMPMVTIYWNWDKFNPNRTTFSSNDCNVDAITNLNIESNLSSSDSKLIFESQYSRNTLTEKMNLVCERSWLVSFAGFLTVMGFALGGLLLHPSERFGRRPLIIISGVLTLVFSLLMAFPVGYAMYAVALCLFRASLNTCHMLLFVQATEVTAPSRRQYIGVFVKSGLLVGQTVLVCASWLLKDWFYTQLFQTALVATILPAVWYLQESPVFLAVRGKYEDSRKVLQKIAKRNGLNVNELETKIDIWLEQMKFRCEIETKAEKGQIKDLFQNRKITLYTIGIIFNCFTMGFLFTGLVLNAEIFGSGLYVDLTVSNAVSLLSVLIVAALLTRMSIRVILIVGYMLEGVTCVVYTVTYGFPLARTIVSVLNRVLISAIFANTRIYVNEVYPTSVRGVGVGFTGFVGAMMSSVSPFMKELGEKTYAFVPFVLFAVLSLVSTILYYIMPDAWKMPITHTVQEFNGLRNRKKSKKTNVYVIETQASRRNDHLYVEYQNVKSFKVLKIEDK